MRSLTVAIFPPLALAQPVLIPASRRAKRALRPFAVDHRRRLAHYRARPMICNACPAKDDCTDSEQGREIVRPLDPWPHSEAGRFHRGIAVVLLGLASVIALVGILLTPSLPDLVFLGLMLAVSALVGLRMSRAFSAMPSGFPDDPVSAADGDVKDLRAIRTPRDSGQGVAHAL